MAFETGTFDSVDYLKRPGIVEREYVRGNILTVSITDQNERGLFKHGLRVTLAPLEYNPRDHVVQTDGWTGLPAAVVTQDGDKVGDVSHAVFTPFEAFGIGRRIAMSAFQSTAIKWGLKHGFLTDDPKKGTSSLF